MRRDLPSGTVTFLFTDIEGSTRLLEALGEHYGEALEAQRRLLRHAFVDAGGVEVDTQGDAFFVVFPAAGDAVRAAAQGQRILAGYHWPEGISVRVRMGLHSGEPGRIAEGYFGLDVHRAARICAAAHGGQVLVSQSTRELLGEELGEGLTLDDLGEHRLKDLTHAQRLYQLTIDGLESRFPAIRTLENSRRKRIDVHATILQCPDGIAVERPSHIPVCDQVREPRELVESIGVALRLNGHRNPPPVGLP